MLARANAQMTAVFHLAGDLLRAAKPLTAGRNTTAIEVRAGWLTEGACSPCPSFCPSGVVMTIGSVFDI